MRFRRSVAIAAVRAYLPASSTTPRQLYAEATVSLIWVFFMMLHDCTPVQRLPIVDALQISQGQYLVVPQDVFRAQFGAERNACADIARDKIQASVVCM